MCVFVQSQLTDGIPPSVEECDVSLQVREEGCWLPVWLQCPWRSERFGMGNIVQSLSVTAGNTNCNQHVWEKLSEGLSPLELCLV